MVILVLGPAGVGKSTISKYLSQKLERSAVIEVDFLRHMIKGGYISPAEKTEHSDRHLSLAVTNACSIAQNFIKEGFDVIIDDVVAAKSRLDLYLELLDGNEIECFLLLPTKGVIQTRDEQRSEENQMGSRALELHDIFVERVKDEDRWHVIDSSSHSEDQTIDEILTILKIAPK